MPTKLLVTAAAMPATCVPCPLMSSTVLLSLKLTLAAILPARSDWLCETPVSTTATIVLALLLLTVQASAASTLVSPHCSPKLGSFGSSTAVTCAFGSAYATSLSPAYACETASAASPAGTRTTLMPSCLISSTTTPP